MVFFDCLCLQNYPENFLSTFSKQSLKGYLCIELNFIFCVTIETEEYREWINHEVFLESRRQIYLNHSELRTLKGQLSTFCGMVLDEPAMDLDDELGHRFIGQGIAGALRKQ